MRRDDAAGAQAIRELMTRLVVAQGTLASRRPRLRASAGRGQ
jgi:hypothetical protein